MTNDFITIPLENYIDMAYFASIEVGTPPQKLTVMVDSGSTDLIIPSFDCDTCPKNSTRFNPRTSSTLRNPKTDFSITYNDGRVDGQVVQESVQFAGHLVTNQTLGLVQNYSLSFDRHCDGILGLGFRFFDQMQNSSTFMENMLAQRVINRNVFSFVLGDEHSRQSILTLGGYNSSLSGNITWSPIVGNYFWSVYLNTVYWDGVAITNDSSIALIDSGTSLIRIPKEKFDPIVKSLNVIKFDNQYIVKCEGGPKVGFQIENTTFTLGPEQYIVKRFTPASAPAGWCSLGIIPHSQPYFMLGDVFMRQFQTIFDGENSRIGFGAPK